MNRLKKDMENKININADFESFKKAFLEENSKHNLISKNDEKFLFEKHFYDSLGIKLFFEKYEIDNATILDIGCGGGFPCVPVALEYPKMQIVGLDSIRKKIDSVREIKDKLDIKNLELICDRAENIKNKKFDIVISRAVADLKKISSYALPFLNKGGYFIAYKSKKALTELDDAKSFLEKSKMKVVEIIDYTLPLEEVYERNLVVIKKL